MIVQTAKKYLRLFLLMLALAMLFAMPASAAKSGGKSSKKPAPKLSTSSLTLRTGDTYTFSVSNAGKDKVRWHSSKSSVLTVDSKGRCKAVKHGTASVTAKVRGKQLRCKVTVKKKPVSVSPVPESMLPGLSSAGTPISEGTVPRKTKNAAQSQVQVGSHVLYSYGQMRQNGMPHTSSCGYCAVASLIGLVKNKKVAPQPFYRFNKRAYNVSYKSLCACMGHAGVKYVYVKEYYGRQDTLKLIEKCPKSHRPVLCYVNGKWATWGYHYVLLIGFTDQGNVLVCDSARDRNWSGTMQRFKIVSWSSLSKSIYGIRNSRSAVYYTSTKSMPKRWGRLESAASQPGFLTTKDPAY